jgi:hypothetical protein
MDSLSSGNSNHCLDPELVDGAALADPLELAGLKPLDRMGLIYAAVRACFMGYRQVSTAAYRSRSARRSYHDRGQRSFPLNPQSDVRDVDAFLCRRVLAFQLAWGFALLAPFFLLLNLV